jgi:type 1 glutamine amidotransferase
LHFRFRGLPSALLRASCAALIGLAASPPQAAAIRILFLGGGTTSHDPAAMRDVMKPVFEKAGMTVEYHTNESVLHADSLARFDVMFVYNAKKGSKMDGTPDLTKAQEDALYGWVEAGHAFIGAHGASSSYLENPRWAGLIGAEYTDHGNDFKYVTIVKPDHGSMAGVKPPTSWDEGRLHDMLRNDLIILATLNDEKTPWTWVHPQGKGWVYYTSSGHDTRVWSDSAFQGQLVQAVKWGYSASQPVSAVDRAHRNGSVTPPAGGGGARGSGQPDDGQEAAAGRNALGRAETGPAVYRSRTDGAPLRLFFLK